jgi:hypothetical protein
MTPVGFIALFSLIIFVGQLIVKDVIKDIKTINIKIISAGINYSRLM